MMIPLYRYMMHYIVYIAWAFHFVNELNASAKSIYLDQPEHSAHTDLDWNFLIFITGTKFTMYPGQYYLMSHKFDCSDWW